MGLRRRARIWPASDTVTTIGTVRLTPLDSRPYEAKRVHGAGGKQRSLVGGHLHLLLPLPKKFVGCLLSLFVTQLFHLLVDSPLVAERIDDLSVTSSPEHILHGHAHPSAGSDRALDNPVRIVNQEGDAHARSPERLRRLAGSTFARGELVADEELVPVQSQFAVHELLADRKSTRLNSSHLGISYA